MAVIINSKFSGKCKRCGVVINIGDQIMKNKWFGWVCINCGEKYLSQYVPQKNIPLAKYACDKLEFEIRQRAWWEKRDPKDVVAQFLNSINGVPTQDPLIAEAVECFNTIVSQLSPNERTEVITWIKARSGA